MAGIAASSVSRPRILAPKEHGAWAVLLTPCVIATGIAGGPSVEALLFLCAAAGCFAARYPIGMAFKQRSGLRSDVRPAALWTAVYGGLAASSVLALTVVYDRWFVLPLGFLALLVMGVQQALRALRLDRTIAGELLAFAGLSLTGPGAYYAISGQLDATAASIWLLSFLYAGAAVFYVKLRVQQRVRRALRLSLARRVELGRGLVAYTSGALSVVVALAAAGQIPPLAPLAFAPLAVKAARNILAVSPELSLRKIGFIEVGHSLAFAALTIAAYVL